MSEVARIRPRSRSVTVINEETPAAPLCDSLVNFVSRAMLDPAIDAAKLEVLLRIQREILAEQALQLFNRAKSAAQDEMEPIVRDTPNKQTNSWYARLETIDKAIRPIYRRHGFHMAFDSETIGDVADAVRIICDLTHEGGHTRRYSLPAMLDVTGPKGTTNKTPLHGLGSSVSYVRRYLKVMIWDLILVAEDNDGNRVRQERTIDGELANGTQAAELYRLLRDCSKAGTATAQAERRFLDAVNLSALRSIKDIPASEFERVRTILIQKRGRIAAAAGAVR